MLLNTTKAAAYLSATTQQLRYWRDQGYGPAYVRRGRSFFYRPEALDAWRDWCEAFCRRHGSSSFGKGRRWVHALTHRPGGEGKVTDADLHPPMLSGKSSQ